jgi:hypothetical protein
VLLVLSGAVKKVTLHRKKVSETTLLRPDDLFFPLKKYTRLYGDPLSARNRSSGHRVCEVEGVRGVCGIDLLSIRQREHHHL